MKKLLVILSCFLLVLSSCTSSPRACTKTVISGQIPCDWSVWNAGEIISFDYDYFQKNWFDFPTFRIDSESLSPNNELLSIYFVKPPEDLDKIMKIIPEELGVASSLSKMFLGGVEADVLTTYKGKGDHWAMDQTILFTTNDEDLGIIIRIVPSVEKLDEDRRKGIQNFLSSLSSTNVK